MKNALATLIGFLAAGWVLSFFLRPGDGLSTLDTILALTIGIPIIIGIAALFGGSSHSE